MNSCVLPRQKTVLIGKAASMSIPAKAHFCWIGTKLPWMYAFAVLSAADNSGLDEIILHHTDTLEEGEVKRTLLSDPRITLRKFDPTEELIGIARDADLPDLSLSDLYGKIASPAAKSDLLRYALLFRYGGIYLDMDTVTVKPLLTLLKNDPFIGSEIIVWPPHVRGSRSHLLKTKHKILSVVRTVCRCVPHGWKAFRKIEFLFPQGFNGAIMGASARHDWIRECMRAMVSLPAEIQVKPYSIGPHLLHETITHSKVKVYPPKFFYPISTEISQHLFRSYAAVDAEKILYAETNIVHWYASVRTKSIVGKITPDYIRDQKKTQMYAAIVNQAVPSLFAAIK